MTRWFSILVLAQLLASPVHAAKGHAVPNNTLIRVGPPVSAATRIQPDQTTDLPTRAEMIQFLNTMVKVVLARNVEAGMSDAGFNRADIEDVLTSPEFEQFVKNVAQDPRVVAMVDDITYTFTNPESLRSLQTRAAEDEAAARQLALRGVILAQRLTLKQAQPFHPPGFWASLWERGKRFLFD